VVILELCWAQVAERGVQSAGVVDLIDEAWKIGGYRGLNGPNEVAKFGKS
jgi:hypothetical protein